MPARHDARQVREEAIRRERRALRRVLLLTVPLGIVFWLLVPNVGPVMRLYSVPANSMAPALRVGDHFVVSRAAYGYSRHSFDLFPLPISGRVPDWLPARGDIIVFRLPRDLNVHFVKRVVGLPGDRVRIANGRLSINGTVVDRQPAGRLPDPNDPAKQVTAYRETLPGGASQTILETDGDTGPFDNTAEVVVPARHIFVLGDNRDNSADSRVPPAQGGVGLVPVENVVGRLVFRY